jgi:hypothetical protein
LEWADDDLAYMEREERKKLRRIPFHFESWHEMRQTPYHESVWRSSTAEELGNGEGSA